MRESRHTRLSSYLGSTTLQCSMVNCISGEQGVQLRVSCLVTQRANTHKLVNMIDTVVQHHQCRTVPGSEQQRIR